MASTRTFNLTLPLPLAEAVEDSIASGRFASADDLLREAVEGLLHAESDADGWIRDEVAKGHAEYLDDPARAIPIDDILEHWQARRRGAAAE